MGRKRYAFVGVEVWLAEGMGEGAWRRSFLLVD